MQRKIPERIQIELLSYLQEIHAHEDGYGARAIFDIMGPTIMTLYGLDCQRRACLLA